MKRIPLLDPTNNQQCVIEGENHEQLPKDNSVYIDQQGKTYDPHQKKVSLDQLPTQGVMELPRTTWWRT